MDRGEVRRRRRPPDEVLLVLDVELRAPPAPALVDDDAQKALVRVRRSLEAIEERDLVARDGVKKARHAAPTRAHDARDGAAPAVAEPAEGERVSGQRRACVAARARAAGEHLRLVEVRAV